MMRKVIHRSTERKIDQTEGKITLETQECSGGSSTRNNDSVTDDISRSIERSHGDDDASLISSVSRFSRTGKRLGEINSG
jgi:hypothetical protein